ncbi:MAG: hypothetical protein AAF630_07295 [Cyanobacteria bacterium P01_C01_bin.38]
MTIFPVSVRENTILQVILPTRNRVSDIYDNYRLGKFYQMLKTSINYAVNSCTIFK